MTAVIVTGILRPRQHCQSKRNHKQTNPKIMKIACRAADGAHAAVAVLFLPESLHDLVYYSIIIPKTLTCFRALQEFTEQSKQQTSPLKLASTLNFLRIYGSSCQHSLANNEVYDDRGVTAIPRILTIPHP